MVVVVDVFFLLLFFFILFSVFFSLRTAFKLVLLILLLVQKALGVVRRVRESLKVKASTTVIKVLLGIRQKHSSITTKHNTDLIIVVTTAVLVRIIVVVVSPEFLRSLMFLFLMCIIIIFSIHDNIMSQQTELISVFSRASKSGLI